MKYLENSTLTGRDGKKVSIQYTQEGTHEEINPAGLLRMAVGNFKASTSDEWRDVAALLDYLDHHGDDEVLELQPVWWDKIKASVDETLAVVWSVNAPAVWDMILDRMDEGADKHKDSGKRAK